MASGKVCIYYRHSSTEVQSSKYCFLLIKASPLTCCLSGDINTCVMAHTCILLQVDPCSCVTGALIISLEANTAEYWFLLLHHFGWGRLDSVLGAQGFFPCLMLFVMIAVRSMVCLRSEGHPTVFFPTLHFVNRNEACRHCFKVQGHSYFCIN
jgi:hypothetical protein